VDLSTPLKPRGKQTLKIGWSFAILHRDAMWSRGGYEHFTDSDTYTYFLAQWFPRMAAYTDYASWQHKQFIGRGEFTLEFGNYDVSLTVPADHVVSATGELTNAAEVLTSTQRERLAEARRADKPVFIVTPQEAQQNEAQRASGTRTWRFVAENVRDFAWASSRKFIWDAMVHEQPQGKHRQVMAMSFYPNEAEPIWSKYSTEAVVHTMEVYSRFSFPYPYPTAQSVNTWKLGGMEYPMITFNGYRPEPVQEKERESLLEETPDVTYDRATKHRLIGVIIHEIGHIYFPMTVNSDERRWTWMDEGLNSFLQYLAELEWEEDFFNYHNQASPLDRIRGYMISPMQVPVMSDADSILQIGPNAYTKPAAALVVLRETVLGRELFDFALREYARRWRFKRPTPADFFRTMEDASAVDLDWFWRGWFYTTDHVDIDLAQVREYKVSTKDPHIERPAQRALVEAREPEPIAQLRNRQEGRETRVQRRPQLQDFYNEQDQYTVTNKDINDYQSYLESLESWEREVLDKAIAAEVYAYFVDFRNVGGLLSPLPLKLTYQDGSEESMLIPAEVWRKNTEQVTKLLILPGQLAELELDPLQQTADTDRNNNYYPRRILPSRLELFKQERESRNLMKENYTQLKGKTDADDGSDVPLDAVQD
ncbi:MAG: M1 family metallopeptidase, partial [Pseudomonadales bacterium]